MSDTGPYAHLNTLTESQKRSVPFLFNAGQKWPAILAQDPSNGSWSNYVPVDGNGFARFDLQPRISSNWKTIDPTDLDALRAAGIDPSGVPHDYSFKGQLHDAIESALSWAAHLIPTRRPEPETSPPVGGIRGDNGNYGDRSPGSNQTTYPALASGDRFDPSQAGPVQQVNRPELRIPPPIFFPFS